MDVKTKVLLIGAPDDFAALAAAAARLAERLDIVFAEQLEAQVIEASELPTGCSNDITACPESVPCGSGCFSGYYYAKPSIEEYVAIALQERPQPSYRPYVPKTIGTPYRGYASTYRRHRR